MNCICSLERAAESSEECCSAIDASEPSKSSPTARKSCSLGSEMESCPSSQSSATSENSMLDPTVDTLTSWLEASLVKTSVSLGKEQELKETGADFGWKWQGSFAKWNQSLSMWKTRQHSLAGDLDEFSETWPAWGSMRNGECFQRQVSVLGISEKESGSWLPTIGKNEFKGAARARFRGSKEYRGAKMSEGLRTCTEDPMYLHPLFAEYAMGWPLTWTELAPLGMDKFLSWLQQHGEY